MNRRTFAITGSTAPAIALTATTNPMRKRTNSSEEHVAPARDSALKVHKDMNCCCKGARRLCCHSLVNPDDLILQQERQRLAHHLEAVPKVLLLTNMEKYKKIMVETWLCYVGFKRPTSCACWNTSVMRLTYRLCQLTVIILLIMYLPFFANPVLSFSNWICADVPLLQFTGSTNSFYCPAIQKHIQTSSYTKNNTGYGGAMKTMKALAKGQLFQRTWSTSTGPQGVDYGDGQLFKGLNMSSITSASSTNPDWIFKRNQFLAWRGETQTSFPNAVRLFFSLAGYCSYIALIFVLSYRCQKDDPTEVLFPALLATKNISTTGTGTGTSIDFSAELHEEEDDDVTLLKKYHFVRPRMLVWDVAFCSGLIGALLSFIIFGYLPTDMIDFLIRILMVPPFFCLSGFFFCGLFVQICNATSLSNILVNEVYSNMLFNNNRTVHSQTKIQLRFEEWKELYKTSVGGLHIWSWRTTPVFGSFLLACGAGVLFEISLIVSIYKTSMTEIDVIHGERVALFQMTVANRLSGMVSYTIGMLITTGAMAQIFTKYKRLQLLIATLGLPKHRLDDFQILQQQNACLTIYDYPMTTNVTINILIYLFVQSVVLAISMMG